MSNTLLIVVVVAIGAAAEVDGVETVMESLLFQTRESTATNSSNEESNRHMVRPESKRTNEAGTKGTCKTL